MGRMPPGSRTTLRVRARRHATRGTHMILENTESSDAEEAGNSRRYLILVIEDVRMIHDVIARTLRELDAELVIAVDGATGLQEVEKALPDLVILDLALPVVDGWEVLRRLRADARTRSRVDRPRPLGFGTGRSRLRRQRLPQQTVPPQEATRRGPRTPRLDLIPTRSGGTPAQGIADGGQPKKATRRIGTPGRMVGCRRRPSEPSSEPR